MKNILSILPFVVLSINIFSQEPNELPDCNCKIKGECIQYLDSIFKPTTKDNAVYMRYNYYEGKFLWMNIYQIEEGCKGKDFSFEIDGKHFKSDTIVFVDGVLINGITKESLFMMFYMMKDIQLNS